MANERARCRIFTINLGYGGYCCLVPPNYRSIILGLHTTVHSNWFSKIPGEKLQVGWVNICFSLWGWELKFLFSHGKDWSFLWVFTIMCTSPYCHLLLYVHHQTYYHIRQVYITSLSSLYYCHLTDKCTSPNCQVYITSILRCTMTVRCTSLSLIFQMYIISLSSECHSTVMFKSLSPHCHVYITAL